VGKPNAPARAWYPADNKSAIRQIENLRYVVAADT
jgi:hypothetical protein